MDPAQEVSVSFLNNVASEQAPSDGNGSVQEVSGGGRKRRSF